MTTRLPEWRYELRRFVVFATIGVLTLTLIGLVTETLGVDICAEDICYSPHVDER